MSWQLILKKIGRNIQNIAGFVNIVADTLSRLPSTSIDKYEPSTRKAQYCLNELFAISRAENNEYCFVLNFLNVKREQQNELINKNYKPSTYIFYRYLVTLRKLSKKSK